MIKKEQVINTRSVRGCGNGSPQPLLAVTVNRVAAVESGVVIPKELNVELPMIQLSHPRDKTGKESEQRPPEKHHSQQPTVEAKVSMMSEQTNGGEHTCSLKKEGNSTALQ